MVFVLDVPGLLKLLKHPGLGRPGPGPEQRGSEDDPRAGQVERADVHLELKEEVDEPLGHHLDPAHDAHGGRR
eukprot:scaffold67735_cov24-Prasinocladus_malaysianus.AAC.2